MLWLIGLLVIAAVAYFVYLHVTKKADAAFEDVAKPVVEEVKAEVVKALDVNKDGKVDLADAKEAVSKAKKGVKKAAGKAKKPKLKVVK